MSSHLSEGRGLDYLRHRLAPAIATLLAIVGAGVAGYTLIEGMSGLEALYMTVITVSTVGFGEVRPLSAGGRVFTILLVVGGVSTLGYSITIVFEYLVGGHLVGRFVQRRKEQALAGLRRHFLICGYGRVGQQLAADLRVAGRRAVVIDAAEEYIRQAEQDGCAAIQGDASSNEILRRASIEHAAGVMVVTGSDAENVYIVLAARVLAPAVPVVARASSDEAVERLQAAGAERVFSPHTEGAQAMASYVLKPHVADVMQELVDPKSAGITIDETTVVAGSPFVGMTIRELDASAGGALREVSVLAIVHDGAVTLVPRGDDRIGADDVMILVGRPEAVTRAGAASRPGGDASSAAASQD